MDPKIAAGGRSDCELCILQRSKEAISEVAISEARVGQESREGGVARQVLPSAELTGALGLRRCMQVLAHRKGVHDQLMWLKRALHALHADEGSARPLGCRQPAVGFAHYSFDERG